MTDTLNLKEWQTALDCGRSFVVDGAAGTGKSELSLQRYLKLMSEAGQPEEVLFLIDGERRLARLRARLAEIVQSPASIGLHEDALRKRNAEQSWNLAEQPDRMQVHTVRTLAAALAEAAPVSSGCGAGIRLTDDPEAYYRIAARALLRTLDHDEHVAPRLETLLLHLDNDLVRTERLLAGLLRRREELQRCLATADPEASRKVLQAALEDAVAMTLADISAAIPEDTIAELTSLMAKAARELATRSSDSPIRAWRDLSALPPADATHLQAWRGLCVALLDENGQPRVRPGAEQGFADPDEATSEDQRERRQHLIERMQTVGRRLAQQPGLVRRIAALRHISEVRYTHLQWTVLQSLLAILPRVMDDLNRAFRALGEMDLTALLQGATRAVRAGQAEIFGATGLQHLVIDDFHELSYAAIDLVESLTRSWHEQDKRTLLITGNPFASVRRDAGAQPALYLTLRHSGLGQCKLEALTLPTVFQSSPAIVECLNQVFGDENGGGVLGEGSMPYWPAATAGSEGGEAKIVATAPGIEAEATEVARCVAALHRQDNHTVAVLLGDDTNAHIFVDALRAQGVDCYSEESERLSQRQVVRDLHALTRALLHLADRVAWLSLLRAPWCGLTLDDLHRLVGDSAGVTVWELIINEQRRSRLSEDGQQRLSRIKRVMAQSLAERGRRDLRRLVEGVWTALGGAVCVRDSHELRHVGDFFEMLSRIDDGGEPDSLEALDNAVELLAAEPGNTCGEVLVTTIRRARRRSYDSVIVAGVSGPIARPEQDDALRWLVRPGQFGEPQLLLAPVHPEGGHDAIDLWLASLQQAQHSNELRRLLYVGANRARERLILVVAPPSTDGQWLDPPFDSPLRTVWPVVKQFLPETPALSSQSVQQAHPGNIRRLPSTWLLPEAPQPKVWNVLRTDAQHGMALSESLDHDQQIVARVMVRTLREIAEQGPTDWAMRSLDGLENHFQRLFGMLGMSEASIRGTADQASTSIRRVLEDRQTRWVLEQHQQAQTPLRISGWLDDILHSFEIDRCFVDQRGTRWLINYSFVDLAVNDDTQQIEQAVADARQTMRTQARLVNRLDTASLRAGLLFPFSATWHDWDPEI